VDPNGEQWLTEMPFRAASEGQLEHRDSYKNDNTAIRGWKKEKMELQMCADTLDTLVTFARCGMACYRDATGCARKDLADPPGALSCV
jgi:hypothetical protein